MSMRLRPFHAASLVFAAAAFGCKDSLRADLVPPQVLVVYDSRATVSTTVDPSSTGFPSRDVAEYYAGSAAVPGGVGAQPGKRPGVRTLDLASTAAPFTPGSDLSYPQFITNLRTPLRTWLTANDPRGAIRSIVLCKGVAHRIYQINSGLVGDNPNLAVAATNSGNYISASVDSELTLLWQELGGETSIPGGTKATGLILNPYWRSDKPITGWSTAARTAAKTFTNPTSPANPIGQYWTANQTALTIPAFSTQLTPGDLYLVCRLDAPTVANVKAVIDRAQSLSIDTDSATFILDEAGASPVTNTTPNSEFDNVGQIGLDYGGDDYEQTRDLLTTDARFLAARIRYDALTNAANFIIGPNINYGGQGLLVSTPVLLISSYGSNTPGFIPGESPAVGPGARLTYATSFNLAPGAIFNSTESFNGRDFGGAGQAPSFAQMQSSAFLAAGGTFALGNVWEPFAETLPDDLQLTRNFFLGNLSFAEAAYTALPALSWQQIVIGDPLARPTRTTEDLTGDARITVDDLYSWHTALPARQDLNRSGTVTDADRKFVEDAARRTRDTDMRGPQR
ncbi:hypothetical protein BH11PLA1_BH11PLA1_22380 [soil metagenome]